MLKHNMVRVALGIYVVASAITITYLLSTRDHAGRSANTNQANAESDTWLEYAKEIDRLDAIYNIVYDREWPGYQYEVAVDIGRMGPDKHHWFMRYYYERELSPNGTSSKGMSMFRWLCGGENDVVVQFLLEEGADPNLRDDSGSTPLVQAAMGGNAAIAQALVDFGANVDEDSYVGLRPLEFAAASGHLGVMQVLLESGANPEGIEYENLGDDIDASAVMELLGEYLPHSK